jgi:prepilin-type processing-associated H-X9-DG protein
MSLGEVVRPSETIQWMEGRTTTRESLGETRRHDRGVNVVFADAHSRWMPEKTFWSVRLEPDGYYWLLYGAADR